MKISQFFLFLYLSLLFGCSTQLEYTMNNFKFLSPEAKGKLLKGDIGMSDQMTHKVVISEAFDPLIFNLPAVTTNVNQISVGNALSMPINLGLLERMDFFTIDGKYGFKYQVLGDPEVLKVEGYKGSIALSYGYDHPEVTNVTYTSSSSVRSYSTDMKVSSYEVNLIFGKRISPQHLFYSSLFHDSYNYKGQLTSTQFATVNVKGKSQNTGLLLGYELSQAGEEKLGAKVKLEGGVVQGKLDSYDKRTSGVVGGMLGFYW